MNLLILLTYVATWALAASSTSSMAATMSGMDMSTVTDSASASTTVDNSPEYSITALPVVQNQSSCVFNCLIPIGLADSSGCDDVTENCACLSAPVDAIGFFSNCIETVCKSSTSAYFVSATSLYESYCLSVYGSSSLAVATTANIAADSAAKKTSSTAAATTTKSAAGKARGVGGIMVMTYAFGGFMFVTLLLLRG